MGFLDKIVDVIVGDTKSPSQHKTKGSSAVINTQEQVQSDSNFISGMSHTVNRPFFGQYGIRTVSDAQIATYLNRNIAALVPVRVLMTDILSKYEVISKNEDYKNQIEEFLIDTNFKMECFSAYKDFLLTGEGFMEPVMRDKNKARAIVESTVKSIFPRRRTKFINSMVDKAISKAAAKGLFDPIGLYRIRSLTIKKLHDKHGQVYGYKQIIQGETTATWAKDELINFSSYKYDSEVYGFSVLKTMFEDILTLDATNEYVRNVFQNNGTPDFIISPKDKTLSAKSPAYLNMKKELMQRQVYKKRGNMLTNAPFEWVKLNSPSDMEFKALLEHLSQVFAKAWDIPFQRLVGAKDRADDATLQAYYERINNVQEDFTELINIKYFRKFGNLKSKVKINFKSNYARNKVRTMTWGQMLFNIGGTSTGEIRDLLGMDKDLPLDITTNPFYDNPDALIGNRGSQQNTPGIDNTANGDQKPKP